jgi:hypothetical protein
MKMKKRLTRFACAAACLILTQGCKEAGFTFSEGNVCHTDANGTTQCQPLDEKHLVRIDRKGGALALHTQATDEVFGPSAAGELEKSGSLITFKAQETAMTWKGDSLTLTEKATHKTIASLYTARAQGLLLIDAKADAEVSLAMYGGVECEDPRDVDAQLSSNWNRSLSITFDVCDSIMWGRFDDLDGGVVILVIDPAILEDRQARLVKDWSRLDPGYGRWDLALDKRVKRPAFLPIRELNAAAFRSPQPAQPMIHAANKSTGGGGSAPEPICLEAIEPTSNWADICSFDEICQVEECDGFLSFANNDNEHLLTVDGRTCSIRVTIDREHNKTTVQCNAACHEAFEGISCK